tara:strand:- start:3629 stop:4078 length:450 start_codon:yes stop_codon:yes gene_type:complete
MGYRSNTSILIYGDDKDVVAFKAGERVKGYPKGMEYHPLNKPEDGHLCDERFIWHTDDGDTMLEYNFFDVKWYDTYPEIAYWEQLKSLFEQAFPSLTMEFARIGEETEDIVTEYYGSNPQYYLAIERTIYKDIPIREKTQNEYLKKYNS